MKHIKNWANSITIIALAFIVLSSFSSAEENENAAYNTNTTEAMTGEVRLWMGFYEPEGWRICDGREIELQKNKSLFQIIGTQFGGTIDNKETWDDSDDTGTFKLPDLRSKRIVDLGANDWDPENNTGQYIICTMGELRSVWDSWDSFYADGIPTGW